MNDLADAIWRRLATNDKTMLTVCGRREADESQIFTGRDLHDASARWAAVFSEIFPVGSGPVVLAMPQGSEFTTALLGAVYAGLTVVPLAIPRNSTQRERFAAIVADCAAEGIICTASVRAAIDAALAESSGPRFGIMEVDDLPAMAPLAVARSCAGGPAVIQYTSGTSRFPRGVKVGGAAILANAAHCFAAWGFDERQVVVNWLPHFHDMGLLGGNIYPILVGASSVQLDPFRVIQRPSRWLRAISDHGGTFSGGPAFAFAQCVQNIRDDECEGLDLSRWSAAYCGAEPVPAALITAFRSRFARFGLQTRAVFACYGLAEYSLMAAGAHALEAAIEPVPPPICAGVAPCRLTEAVARTIRIIDPAQGAVLRDGEVGEICLHGPSVAGGYVGQTAESEETFRHVIPGQDETWLRTGDIGVISDRNLYVVGRLKDVLTVNGRKVAASEIEWLAAQMEPALNPMAAAAFMPDEMRSGEAALLIEMRAARTVLPDPDKVRQQIAQAVAGTFGIKLLDVELVDRGTLPRTSSGKIRRREAAALYRQGAANAACA